MSNQAFGEAVAHVVDSADGEAVLGDVDGGELDEPAGLAGVAVHDADDALERCRLLRRPPLREELEVLLAGDELGAVVH